MSASSGSNEHQRAQATLEAFASASPFKDLTPNASSASASKTPADFVAENQEESQWYKDANHDEDWEDGYEKWDEWEEGEDWDTEEHPKKDNGNDRPDPEDWNSPAALQQEHEMALEHRVKWQHRGPPGPEEGGPDTWRKQPYRPLSGKWAKRGGRHKAYFSAKYASVAATGAQVAKGSDSFSSGVKGSSSSSSGAKGAKS